MKGNNVVVIVGGTIIIIIIESLLPYGTPAWIKFGVILFIGYLCLKRVNRNTRENNYKKVFNPAPASTAAQTPYQDFKIVIPKPKNDGLKSNNSALIWGILVVLVTAIALTSTYWAAACIYFNNVVDAPAIGNKFINWGILGLLVGAAFGGYVAYKKYKVAVKYLIMPIALLIVFLALLFVNFIYLKTYPDDNLVPVVKIDSTRMQAPVVMPRHLRHHRFKKAKNNSEQINSGDSTSGSPARTDTTTRQY